MNSIKKRDIFFRTVRILGDIFVIHLSYLLAFYLRYLGNIPQRNFDEYIALIPHITIAGVVIFKLYDLYSDQLRKDISEIFYALIPASVIIVVTTIALSFFFRAEAFPRSIFLVTTIIMVPAMIIWRYINVKVEGKFIKPRNIVVVGVEEEIAKLIQNIKNGTNGGFNLAGIILREKPEKLARHNYNFKIGLDNLPEKLNDLEADLIFLSDGLKEEEKKKIFHHSLEHEWDLMMVPGFYEIMMSGSRLLQIGELPVYEVKNMREGEGRYGKRLVDIALSITGIIISLPVTLLTAIAIKLESRGPVFFKQERISKEGNTFKVYKFRTMVENAEAKTGPVLAEENDARVTKVGSFLRKTRIDEIPQFINVLKGDMSIIGPRPERPHFVKEFRKKIPEYRYRHRIKSGITGLAQIHGYYSSDPEDKLRMDLLYANKSSFVFDLKIMLETIKVMLMGQKKSR